MPALWQSSQRPMYVRTVWVGGFRHAILSPDDPYSPQNPRNRRPQSSATCSAKSVSRKRSARYSDPNSLEDCIKHFNFVIGKDQYQLRPTSSHEPDIERLDLHDVAEEFDDDFIVKVNRLPLYEFETSRTKIDGFYSNMKTLRTNRTGRSEAAENTGLSDRVLQWLDLAGKEDLLATNKVERMAQPRHSWPELQRRNYNLMKSKTTCDVRGRESKMSTPKNCDSAKAPQSGTIDRYDFYVPTSANTIEKYARQSRNYSTRLDLTMKTKDNKTKAKELQSNILEARKKIASEREEMEKKYADLVSKKLIPDLKNNKKQVHIFMPDLPKKAGSNATSRTESLLSQFSHLTKT